ncbi:MAG TPA: SGNH/GDSL hydrolase family protein [Oculatellaceae cyanobacterium]
MKLEPNTKLLFIGDSITDAERHPQGEGLFDALGKGYVSQVDALLGTVYHKHAIRVINKGISGNTVRDLKARWQQDVTEHNPDWLSIMIGINDVWRQFDLPQMKELHINIQEYENTLNELVDKTLPSLKGLVLMTPYYIEPSKTDAMRAMMDEYGAAVKRTASRVGAVFVDTQAAFDTVLKSYYPAMLAWDRVHPTAKGVMVISRAFLKAIDFDWRHETGD